MPDSFPTCRCGHDRTHPLVHLVPSYGPLAWIWLMAGASATPRSATYTCRTCGARLGETRDPALLRTLR
jgi:hypothetical protein